MKVKALEQATFEFVLADGRTIYSAHWYPNTTAPDLNKKYEVAIFRGGGYKESYYTDNRICEKNSKEYIEHHLTGNNKRIAKHGS